jgi:hypothetical protein
MIARKLTPAQVAALKPGDAVLWLKAGGTNYEEAFFKYVIDGQKTWCIVDVWEGTPYGVVKCERRIKISSLGAAS